MSSATGPKGKQMITQNDKNHSEIHRQNVLSSRVMRKKKLFTRTSNAKCRKEIESKTTKK